MSHTATLSSEFEITIPQDICEAQGWKVGQEILIIPEGAGVLLVSAPSQNELQGNAPLDR